MKGSNRNPTRFRAAPVTCAVTMADYLAWLLMKSFRRIVAQEQQRIQRSREDIAPFLLATWSSWLALSGHPQLRMQQKFPVTNNWMRLMQQEAVELVGDCVLLQAHVEGPALTSDQLSAAAACRATIFDELDFLPTYMEEKVGAMPTVLRPSLEKAFNAVAELFQQAAQITEDPLLFRVANRMSETCVRCRMRIAEDTTITRGFTVVADPHAGDTPPGDETSLSDENLSEDDGHLMDGVGHSAATRD